ncbi:MAG: hypothetical protein Q9225_003177 [Loekoesia sp. 1 TL-2023]
MHLQITAFLPLLLVYGASSAPLEGQPGLHEQAPAPGDSGTGSLESTPGPYKFEPAPVWPRVAPQSPGRYATSSPGSLESTPGPYKFKPAPVWPRSEPASGREPSSPPGSLESTPGPYKFEPAPVWPRGAPASGRHSTSSSGSLENTPGPYKFKPAPVWPPRSPVSRRQSNPSSGSLESTPGPYTFEPAPVWATSGSHAQKGAGMWAAWHVEDMVKDSGATWAYSWDTDPASAFTAMGQNVPAGVEVVVMVNAPSKADGATLQKIKSSGAKVVLGYNEPDGAEKSGQYSLADAVSAWTKITKALAPGLRIGSPAPAGTNVNDPNDWFVKFMQQTQANGAKVDFICLHHYASESDVASGVANFKSFVESVHNKYKLPIWVTEYAMVDYTLGPAVGQLKVPDAATQVDYMKQSTAMLKSLSYVERFAWFAMPQSDAQAPTNLYTSSKDGWQRTQYGEAYKAI